MFEQDTPRHDARHRVVIVGGGVAGLDLAGALARDTGLAVTLIDLATAHVWKPMLHSIAAGTRASAGVEVPYVAQARRHGFTYAAGPALDIDRAARTVHVDRFVLHGRDLLPERRIAYDTLVLAVGSVAAPFGVEGVEAHARHIDTLIEAQNFQADLLPRLVEAAHAGRQLRIAIVGGGATGVQFAAELLQMADIAGGYGLNDSRATLDVTLVDRGPRLLPAFPETVSAAARARLEGLGVHVRTDVKVVAVDEQGLRLDDGAIPADMTVWAAGVQAAPLAKSLTSLTQDQSGRLCIDRHCRSVDDPAIFAIGDCASLTPQGEERPLPPTAQIAYQQAVYLGRHLPAMLAGKEAPPFRHRDFGALVKLGEYDGYADLGKFGISSGVIRGRLARLGHEMLYRRHQMRLHGRAAVLRLWLADRLTSSIRPDDRVAKGD
ncbi:NAD(P)/FAD-dependent oxidoreductase [Sphingomonas pseudosanguinis]|uniref:NADH dehydrogenase n=1 Tax=Sphingomonas pseudosanguinis TaxID=413712 RepID=A0A7W6AEC0_9SPHN|nr:NAD(P)/FAD-dependent oxidoreductase [Sphingomonas pseudosanguinis]MBB3880698.1 NADH dehydrogenase [Sphingomonas pseudosanguinis]MBN3535170.1 NAD(P)/FAD-dependent oxidoreductase [Sphingomonas pseudosanguinis]